MQYKEWMEEWLELYARATTKERTYRKYRRQAEKYLLPALGEREIEGFTAVDLQKFSVALSERELAPSTVNGVLSVLKASLKKAVEVGVADRQFAYAIVRPKVRESKVTCFTKAEQRKIEQYVSVRGTAYFFGILLSLYTGLRIGELLALTWEDIDLIKGTMSVTKSCHDSWENGRYKKVLDTTKTLSSERIVPLPKQIAARMVKFKREAKSPFIVNAGTEYGAEMRTYQRMFEMLLKKLGIAHRGFHALRHTFATRAIEVGMDVKTLSEVLGHKDPTITLQRYTHSLMEHKTEMMNKVGRLLTAADLPPA